MSFSSIKEAKQCLNKADAILIITGAGMSADSDIITYRGDDGLWTKTLNIDGIKYKYDEISNIKMWNINPHLAWGFKSKFYKDISNKVPHKGYYKLLKVLQKKYNNNYFICTSNIDIFFEKSGYDSDKIYEVHGSLKYLQCMDKKCSIKHGIIDANIDLFPDFDKNLIAKKLPKCPNCKKNILRPNVSMFGDFDFYGKPYEYQKKRMNNWLKKIKKNNQKLVILEIGCGISEHSLRINNGIMMSGEWKLPKIQNLIKTIRINPFDLQESTNTIQITNTAKNAINQLF